MQILIFNLIFFKDLIHEINRFRTLKMDFYAPSSQVMANFGCEILPWTATPGEGGLRDSLLSQVCLYSQKFIRRRKRKIYKT